MLAPSHAVSHSKRRFQLRLCLLAPPLGERRKFVLYYCCQQRALSCFLISVKGAYADISELSPLPEYLLGKINADLD